MIRILHVDDEENEHIILKLNLSRLEEKFDIQWVESAPEALTLLHAERFDCILSDFQMPGMNGLEFLTALKERELDTPFIFLTGQGSEKLAAQALRAGASDYYTKDGVFAHYDRLSNSIFNHVGYSQRKQESLHLEKKALEHEKNWQLMLKNSTSGFALHKIITDENDSPVDYVFLEINEEFERQTGLKREKIIGKKVTEVISGIRDTGFDWIKTYGEVAQTGKSNNFEQYDENLKQWFSVTAYSPKKGYFVVNALNITSRKDSEIALKASEEKANILLNATNDIVMLLDPDGFVITANNSALKSLDKTMEEITGINIFDLSSNSDIDQNRREFYQKYLQELKPMTYQDINRRRYFTGTLFPIFNDKGTLKMSALYVKDETKYKKAQADLLKERNIFKGGPTMVITWLQAEGWPVSYVSSNVKKILGYEPEEFLDPLFHFSDLIHPDDIGRVDAEIEEHLAENRTFYEQSYRLRTKRGEYKRFKDYTVPELEKSGEVALFRGYLMDQSGMAGKEIELTEDGEMFRRLVEDSPDMIYRMSLPDGKYEYVNPASQRVIGYSREELLETPKLIEKMIHPSFKDYFQQEWKELLAGNMPPFYEYQIINGTTGDTRWIHQRNVLICDEECEPKAIEGIVTDITDFKIVDENLKIVNRDLENANNDLESFSHTVAHDLKAPLRYISGFANLLLEEIEEKLDASSINHLHAIADSAAGANKLVADILRFSVTNKTEIIIEDVDLTQIANEIKKELKTSDPERVVDFEIDENLRARGDEGLLKVMLENLLGNAWKFTSKTENGKISFGLKETSGEKIFFIKDNGAGFEPSRVTDMFSPFQRFHSCQEFKGTGIGLATVKRIIERHSGKIWAEGVPRGGSYIFLSYLRYLFYPPGYPLDNRQWG